MNTYKIDSWITFDIFRDSDDKCIETYNLNDLLAKRISDKLTTLIDDKISRLHEYDEGLKISECLIDIDIDLEYGTYIRIDNSLTIRTSLDLSEIRHHVYDIFHSMTRVYDLYVDEDNNSYYAGRRYFVVKGNIVD